MGTGERLKVQESWAKYYPKIEEGRDCVIAYLGKLIFLHKKENDLKFIQMALALVFLVM